jgi:hypothetical protein
MAREPQRAAAPHHLNAATVPVERALLARAEVLEAIAGGETVLTVEPDRGAAMAIIATEFRTLAAELHYW